MPSAKNMGFPLSLLKTCFRVRSPFCLTRHSQRESRLRAIGRTQNGRGVFIVFTLRRKGEEILIRPVSARYMHNKEIDAFEKENPEL